MSKYITVSFPPGTEEVFQAVRAGKEAGVPISTHARNLIKRGLGKELASFSSHKHPRKRTARSSE